MTVVFAAGRCRLERRRLVHCSAAHGRREWSARAAAGEQGFLTLTVGVLVHLYPVAKSQFTSPTDLQTSIE